MLFKDRVDAGRQLAKALKKYKGKDVVVYAIPRGGVVLGVEIVKQLHAPLDLIITRKIGHPISPEYAVAIVSEDGHIIYNQNEEGKLDNKWLQQQIVAKQAEAQERRKLYLKGKRPIDVKNKTAILVDDGVATGLSFLLAIKELKHHQPKKIIAAIPVAPRETAEKIKEEVDDLIALDAPENYLGAVGSYYQNFDQVSDMEVVRLMQSIV